MNEGLMINDERLMINESMLPLPFGGGFGVLGGKEYFCGGVGEGGKGFGCSGFPNDCF